MNELIKLRDNLRIAELDYICAQGSLDSSPLQVVVAKEELKIARYNYALACRDYVEEILFCEDGA